MAVSTQPAVAPCCALALGLGSAPAAKASPPLHYSTDAYRGKATAPSKRRALAQALAQRLGSRTLHVVEAPGDKPQQVVKRVDSAAGFGLARRVPDDQPPARRRRSRLPYPAPLGAHRPGNGLV